MLNNLLLLAYKCNHYYHGCFVDKQRMDWLPSQTRAQLHFLPCYDGQ
jgi:hypothetical protein